MIWCWGFKGKHCEEWRREHRTSLNGEEEGNEFEAGNRVQATGEQTARGISDAGYGRGRRRRAQNPPAPGGIDEILLDLSFRVLRMAVKIVNERSIENLRITEVV